MHFIGDNADLSGNNIVAGIGSFGNNMSVIGDNSAAIRQQLGNLGAFGFANNIGLIGSAASESGNNTQRVGRSAGSRRTSCSSATVPTDRATTPTPQLFGGFAQNIALIGSGADGSGNNSGIFNFALVGRKCGRRRQQQGGGFNVAIFPGDDQATAPVPPASTSSARSSGTSTALQIGVQLSR